MYYNFFEKSIPVIKKLSKCVVFTDSLFLQKNAPFEGAYSLQS